MNAASRQQWKDFVASPVLPWMFPAAEPSLSRDFASHARAPNDSQALSVYQTASLAIVIYAN